MTNSPPLNVETECNTVNSVDQLKDNKIMTSGIDTLVFALDIVWSNQNLFEILTEMKARAKADEKDRPGIMRSNKETDEYLFNLRPFGAKGHEWILTGHEFDMRIGNWMEPRSRPSVMVEIRSETLWRDGPFETYMRILRLLENNNGKIIKSKISRADLCVDILLSNEIWKANLVEYLVTKAKKWNLWMNHKGIEGLYVGTGSIRGRLYDKPLEIIEKSKKNWMFKIWNITEVPEDKNVIRVEFQIRREVLKELGLGQDKEFFSKCDEGWAYCTKKWMKFQNGRGKHPNQRKTFEWWKMVQEGFLGVQEVCPAIREKAIKEDKEQLMAQIMGCASSLTALEMEEKRLKKLHRSTLKECIGAVILNEKIQGKGDSYFADRVMEKRARYSRGNDLDLITKKEVLKDE